MDKKCVLTGTAIVVLDRGFVYVGKVTVEGDWCLIEKAQNIRVWGTTKGLGELVNGPTNYTKLDIVGNVSAPMRAVPWRCARKSAVRTARATGTVQAAKAGVAISIPSMAERTEMAGVMTPSP